MSCVACACLDCCMLAQAPFGDARLSSLQTSDALLFWRCRRRRRSPPQSAAVLQTCLLQPRGVVLAPGCVRRCAVVQVIVRSCEHSLVAVPCPSLRNSLRRGAHVWHVPLEAKCRSRGPAAAPIVDAASLPLGDTCSSASPIRWRPLLVSCYPGSASSNRSLACICLLSWLCLCGRSIAHPCLFSPWSAHQMVGCGSSCWSLTNGGRSLSS